MGLMQEFKAWITKGNLLEIAIGLILALSFAKLIDVFVSSLITPLLGAIGGSPDFSKIDFKLNGSTFTIGVFMNALIAFVIIGFVLFMVAKGAMKMMKNQPPEPDEHLEVLKSIESKIAAR